MNKTKLKPATVLSILLFTTFNLIGQHSKGDLRLEFNTMLTSYNGKYHLCNCDYRYDGVKPNKNVLITSLRIEKSITENWSYLLGIQHHQLKYANDYIVQTTTGGFSDISFDNYDYNIVIKKNNVEIPLYFKVHQNVTPKLSFGIMLGSSLFRTITGKVTITKKTSGNTFDSRRLKSEYHFLGSAELHARISYSLNSKIDIYISTLVKLRSFSKSNNNYFGEGIGLSYRLK